MVVAFIVKRRKERRISQFQMAKKLGISRRQYQRMEDGKCKMPVSTLESLCEELGLKILIVDKALVA